MSWNTQNIKVTQNNFQVNLVFENFEKQIISDKRVRKIRSFRYVDDMYEEEEKISKYCCIRQLNTYPNIKITIEEGIKFFDLWITKSKHGLVT